MKCAEAAVKVMRLMFPLPVAIVSTIGKMDVPNEKDPVTATIHNFLKEVKPLCGALQLPALMRLRF